MNKQKLLEILNDWNFWNRDIPNFIPRKEYEDKIKEYDKSNYVTVLKGIRRSGKSTLMLNHINELHKKGISKEQILFVNFEDPRFIEELNVSLLEQIFETYREFIYNQDNEIYVFLDEVQNIQGWEKWVRTQQELKHVKKIYVTGSSSKLLSMEFGTALAGRFLDIDVFPLSFSEFLKFRGIRISKNTLVFDKIKIRKLFYEYIEFGGFPEIVLNPKELVKKEVMTYYETIILKDIVARYNLKNANNVRKVAHYLISNISKPVSINTLRKMLNISYDLCENYYNYLKEVYLIFEISKYDYSLKKQNFSLKKIYSIDHSFNQHIGFKFSEDKGRLLENLVFIELKRRGKDVYYHRDKGGTGRECDFVIKQGLEITEAIQVTTSLEDPETKKRELQGLIDALKTYNLKQGLILTEDEEQEFIEKDKKTGKEFKIKVLPVWKFLLF